MARKLTDKFAFEGESITATFSAPSAATSVVLNYATEKKTGTKAAVRVEGTDNWVASLGVSDLKGITGDMCWRAIASSADGADVVANGRIYIRPLVSEYRKVIAAIDEALKSWDTNPNHTVSVGEITITAKTRQDLVTARAFWEGKANADEAGTVARTSGPRRVLTCFGRY